MLKVAAMGKVAGTHKSFERTVLWLANCYFAYNSLGFPAC
jgi:hypothetical protein